MLNLKRILKVWFLVSGMAAQSQLLTNRSGLLFITGKIVRFVLYFIFLFGVIKSANGLTGFSLDQAVLFFLVFTLVDTLAQFLFRGVYRFRSSVVNGSFDLDLLKPLPALFYPVFGWMDILDAITLVPFIGYMFYFIASHGLSVSSISLLFFVLMLFNSLLVAFALHLSICGVCIVTLSIDYLTWLYRDLTALGRFPTDIYPKNIRFILTFIFPVTILMTIPTKALLGLITGWSLVAYLAFGVVTVFLSLRFWHFALKKYSSASS